MPAVGKGKKTQMCSPIVSISGNANMCAKDLSSECSAQDSQVVLSACTLLFDSPSTIMHQTSDQCNAYVRSK